MRKIFFDIQSHNSDPRLRNNHLARPRTASAYLSLVVFMLILQACSIAPLSIPTSVNSPDIASPTGHTAEPFTTPVPSSTRREEPQDLPVVIDTPLLPTSQLATPIQSTVEIPGSPLSTKLPPAESTSDLLFISQNNLMRWDYVTGYTGVLVPNVLEFSASGDGQRIALLRARKIAANGVELFDLAILDFDTKQITTITEGTSRLYKISISPDGRWITYLSGTHNEIIYANSAANNTKRIKLGTCESQDGSPCQQIAWSPDSASIIWSDLQGVWIANLKKQTFGQVHTNKITVIDPKGQNSEALITFSSLQWSPRGRYILTKIIPSSNGVRWYSILDTLTGRLADVPHSYHLSQVSATISWMNDGNLLLAYGGDKDNNFMPFLKLWQLIPTHDDLLILDKSLDLASDDFPPSPSGQEHSYCFNWLTLTHQGIISLGMTVPNSGTAPILFTLDLKEGSLQKIIELPNDLLEVIWAPDGSGALLLAQEDQVFFIRVDNGTFENLRLILGADADSFIWLPPAPRT